MHPRERAQLGVPKDLQREITRYGGVNPHGGPNFRVVWAENVLEQSFGQMTHLPRVSADADITDLEPERYESGEFWTPRYMNRGAILERWAPASSFGSKYDWESEVAADGVTRMMGEFPRHGGYFMISDEFQPEMMPVDYWKREIARELRRQANAPTDPASYLSLCLYLERVSEQQKREAFLEEVNTIHRSTIEPMLATVGRTAQMVRDQAMEDAGLTGHLSAG